MSYSDLVNLSNLKSYYFYCNNPRLLKNHDSGLDTGFGKDSHSRTLWLEYVLECSFKQAHCDLLCLLLRLEKTQTGEAISPTCAGTNRHLHTNVRCSNQSITFFQLNIRLNQQTQSCSQVPCASTTPFFIPNRLKLKKLYWLPLDAKSRECKNI